jgi:hypothetical protein
MAIHDLTRLARPHRGNDSSLNCITPALSGETALAQQAQTAIRNTGTDMKGQSPVLGEPIEMAALWCINLAGIALWLTVVAGLAGDRSHIAAAAAGAWQIGKVHALGLAALCQAAKRLPPAP